MSLRIAGKNFDVTKPLKEHVKHKIDKLKKYSHKGFDASMTLKIQRYQHIADLTVEMNGTVFHRQEVSKDMYASVDVVIDKIESQMRRHKEKITEHNHRGRKREKLILTGRMMKAKKKKQEKQPPKVIKVEKFASKPMFMEEAVMQVDMSEDQFLVFINAETGKVNVLYKRKDGNIGLIEPF